MLSELVIYIR